MNKTYEELLNALNKRGFETAFASTKEEAKEIVLKETLNAKSVGWGGSETIKALGVREIFEEKNMTICDHQILCDVFLLSANAITTDGRIVNIDGRGNRVAASISGPSRVIYVIGRNKIVSGGIDEAIARIKKFACPPNTRRLGKKTPCAETGICVDCSSPDRICKVTVIFDRCPTLTPTKVILVDEDLGF